MGHYESSTSGSLDPGLIEIPDLSSTGVTGWLRNVFNSLDHRLTAISYVGYVYVSDILHARHENQKSIAACGDRISCQAGVPVEVKT